MTDLERNAAKHAKDNAGHRWIWLAVVLIVVGMGYYVWTTEEESADLRTVVAGLADQVTGLGGTPKVAPPDEPDEPVVPIASDDAIRTQVADYFADHPTAQPPTVDEVTRIVARIYREDPPKDGKRGKPGRPGQDATAEQVAAAVADYCSAERCTGAQGAQGPSPTSEEIAAAVTAYCAEHGECRGADGTDGARGDSAIGHRFERVEGDCRSVMTFERADGSTYEKNSDAGEAACGPPDPPNGPGG